MSTVWMLLQFFLALAILVGVHEAGHMIAAKLFGMRVEKFSIGFPPKIFGFKKGETEYSLGLIPLGGFVKITGMVDESFDTANLDKEPEPYEFRAKPAWQRLIVMLGGIIVNVVTGIIVFVILTASVPDTFQRVDSLPYGINASSFAEQFGFRDGDQLLSVDGEEFTYFKDFKSMDLLYSEKDKVYEVKHEDGTIEKVVLPADSGIKVLRGMTFISPRQLANVGNLDDFQGELAYQAGIREGDIIRSLGEDTVAFVHDLFCALDNNAGKEVAVGVERAGELLSFNVKLAEESPKLGVTLIDKLPRDTVKYSFGQALVKGPKTAFRIIYDNYIGLKMILQGRINATKALSGPVGIAKLFGGNMVQFWTLVGILSMVLAFMNLLPIPALDGGHVVFLLFEMVSGRKPSDRFMEIALKVGFAILIVLILFALGNDIVKLFSPETTTISPDCG